MEETANELIDEKSPYLLQHAHNPVNWYPWSEEAFEKSLEEDKPIFLSIGYSTCHWCHVMERESFEDEEVAEILNEDFVSIKVDREERPDIDDIYMSVCQSMTGRGGWPLTIIMTPDKKPFFAGTYFPKESKLGRPGLLQILNRIKKSWTNQREKLLQSSEEITKALQEHNIKGQTKDLNTTDLEDLIERGFNSLKNSFDPAYGGFGGAPKFPSPHSLMFLLRYAKVEEDQEGLTIVEETLDSMYQGGIYDHIGYGFSRYSTDDKWLVPHFEKMLYDNALLAIIYLEAYQILNKESYAQVAEEILSYINRDMTASEGAFYSAEDADSEGVEGKYYVWTPSEIKEVLGKEKGEEFCQTYNITEEGNFEGKNIPNLIDTDLNKVEVDNKFAESRRKLFLAREDRIRPAQDDKILTGWNGLMIAAFAKADQILNKSEYKEQAKETAQFIWANLRREEDGRLLARYREGEADYLAYAQDYAFFIWGLIELYQSTFKVDYLEKALTLNEDLIHYFWDQEEGGLYLYGSDGEKLITRPKKLRDAALPSGNSIATLNWLRLAKLIGKQELEEMAEEQVKYFYQQLDRVPRAYTAFLMSVLFIEKGGQEVVIVTEEEDEIGGEMINYFQQEFTPFSVIIAKGREDDELKKLIPYIADYNQEGGQATAYVCQNFSCLTPVTTVDEFRDLIDNSQKSTILV
ncbi:thioredoxin domain-containing protein [Halanaerocella petrolearia]